MNRFYDKKGGGMEEVSFVVKNIGNIYCKENIGINIAQFEMLWLKLVCEFTDVYSHMYHEF